MTKLPPVWYNEQVGGNVLSFAEIEDHPSYELDYDKTNKRFIITDKISKKTFHFMRKSGGKLYIYTPEMEATYINTVKDMRKQFTP